MIAEKLGGFCGFTVEASLWSGGGGGGDDRTMPKLLVVVLLGRLLSTSTHVSCVLHLETGMMSLPRSTVSSMTLTPLKTHFAVSATAFIANVTIPQTVEEARTLPDKEQWEQSMELELKAFEENNTYILVELPPASRSRTDGYFE